MLLSMDTWDKTSLHLTDSQLVKRAFGEVVSARRNDEGFKQRTFSRVAGISNSHMRGIESGEVSPTLVTLFKIAATLDIEPEQLVGDARLRMEELRPQIEVEYLENDDQ